jgi:hypothetical protein
MKFALIGLGVIAAIVAVVLAIGFMLPVKHTSSRQALYHQPAAKIFALITNVKEFPSWRSSVKTVEVLPPAAGRPRFREIGSDGSILYEIDSAVPPTKLVARIADPSLPFGGKWTYDLTPDGESTILRITEDGEVYNPFFRFVSRFILGHTRTIDRYLHDVAKHFGEESTLVIESR